MWYTVRQSAVTDNWYVVHAFTGKVVNDFGRPILDEWGHDITEISALTLCKMKNDTEWREWSKFQMANFAKMGKWS